MSMSGRSRLIPGGAVACAATLLLSLVAMEPDDAIAGESNGPVVQYGAGHQDPGDLPSDAHRFYRSAVEQLGKSAKTLSRVAASGPGLKAWSLPHDEVLMQLEDGRYALIAKKAAAGKSPQVVVELVEEKLGKRMSGFGEAIEPTAQAAAANELAGALSSHRTAEASRLFRGMTGKSLSKEQLAWLQGPVDRAALELQRQAAKAKKGKSRLRSEAATLADMSRALSLRRARDGGNWKKVDRIPDDAGELWVAKDWPNIARLPSRRLVPGKPLGTTASFRMAILDMSNKVRVNSSTVEVDGVQYVRRPTKKKAAGDAKKAAIGGTVAYLILRHTSAPSCEEDSEENEEDAREAGVCKHSAQSAIGH